MEGEQTAHQINHLLTGSEEKKNILQNSSGNKKKRNLTFNIPSVSIMLEIIITQVGVCFCFKFRARFWRCSVITRGALAASGPLHIM